MPDVAAVEVDFNAKTATVTAKPNSTITRQSVENVLKAAGYGVTTFDARSAAPAGS